MPFFPAAFRVAARYGFFAVTVGLALAIPDSMADVGVDAKQRIWQWQGAALPQLISGLPKAQSLVSRDGRHFVLDENGGLWAWGSNDAAQLGLGHFKAVATPQKLVLPDQVRLQSVAAGSNHTLAVDTSGQIWVWGSNARGQLGSAPASSLYVQTTPLLLSTPFKATQVSANLTQSLARDSEGQTWQWGAVDAGHTTSPKPFKNAIWPKQPKSPAPQVRLISGQVTNSSNKPVAGADILVNGQSCARTQADGTYICALPAGLSGEMNARANGLRFTQRIKLPVANDHNKANWMADAPAEPPSVAKASPLVNNSTPSNVPPIANPGLAVSKAPPTASSAIKSEAIRKTTVTLSGWVRTGSSAGSGLGGVTVQGKGASCSNTDDSGRFSCQVAAGWNGTLSVSKPGYRFAPSSVSLSGTQEDDPDVQTFRAYFEPR